ncbi:MAG TPA: hypothetical protein ENI61_04415 [Ignavibacteria bacterium]|nr:hypothetical protein [Ignavibacteria bacterium]
MKKFILLFALLFFLTLMISQNVYSLCEKNQININNASKEELDNLRGIGLVKAQAIIDSRIFNSVNDLIKVKGIGNITLNKIKEQGLACVNKTNNSSVNRTIKKTKTNIINNTKINKNLNEVSIIKLTPKVIKMEKNIRISNKNKYAIYGFVIFSVLLAFLFLLKRKKFKNEFN